MVWWYQWLITRPKMVSSLQIHPTFLKYYHFFLILWFFPANISRERLSSAPAATADVFKVHGCYGYLKSSSEQAGHGYSSPYQSKVIRWVLRLKNQDYGYGIWNSWETFGKHVSHAKRHFWAPTLPCIKKPRPDIASTVSFWAVNWVACFCLSFLPINTSPQTDIKVSDKLAITIAK